MFQIDECFLCGELQHHGGRIATIGNFQIVSDIAPLNRGHILIGSLEHRYSFSSFATNELDQIEILINHLKPILKKSYQKNIVMFEHGMGNTSNPHACGIVHCHLHLVPIAIDSLFWGQRLIDFLEGIGLSISLKRVHHFRDLVKFKRNNYLFTEDIDGSKWLVTTSGYFPAQVLRKYVAICLGSPETYDWQLYPNQRDSQNTTRFLREVLQEEMTSLQNLGD